MTDTNNTLSPDEYRARILNELERLMMEDEILKRKVGRPESVAYTAAAIKAQMSMMAGEEDRSSKPGRKLVPFTWYSKSIEEFPHVGTLDKIKSLAYGVTTVLELIEADEMNDDDTAYFGRVLQPDQTAAMLRLAIAVTDQVQVLCDGAFTYAEDREKRMSKAAAD